MLKKAMAAIFALGIALTAGTAGAQCTLGVYADLAGTESTIAPVTEGETFTFYCVFRNEGLVGAVGYSLDIPGFMQDLFIMGQSYGPGGGGLNASDWTQGLYAVGLGGCFPGFNNVAVEVARYDAIIINPLNTGPRTITLGANPEADPGVPHPGPVFDNCQGQILDCDQTSDFLIQGVVATEASSFGAVKSLF